MIHTALRLRESWAISACFIVMLGAGACGHDDGPIGPEPRSGINVTIDTKGLDFSSAFVLEAIDGSRKFPFTVFATTTNFYSLVPGSYELVLSGLSSNCTVVGGTRQTVVIDRGETVAIRFNVTCVATLGVVLASVTTSGPDPDLTGYTLTLENGQSIQQLTNQTAAFQLPGGEHTVELTGVASNCAHEGERARTVNLSVGSFVRDTVRIAYHIACQATEKFTFSRVADKVDWVWMASADGSEEVKVVTGSAATWSPDGSRIAFSSVECSGYDFYYRAPSCTLKGLATLDPRDPVATLRRVTQDPSDSNPVWRPTGGGVIAFTRSNSIYIVDVNGTSQPIVVPDSAKDLSAAYDPTWSPDASYIAFTCASLRRTRDICIARPDGSGFRRLTINLGDYRDPAWSPDGTVIAFSTGNEIALVPAAGGAITRITYGDSPAWAPDGKLLFRRWSPDGGIFVLAFGSDVRRITRNDDYWPAWRP